MITFAAEMKNRLLKRCMMTAVMLLSVIELVMADDGGRVGCLVNWTPQAFSRGGQTRSELSDIAYADMGWDANFTYRQLTNAAPLYNAAGATMNITKVTTVKNALTNLGTINVPVGAELRAYDVEIKNDATSLTDYGVINNAGVVGVTYATTGTVNNYGKIIMENSDAITLLTSNQTAAGNFDNAFNAGTNKLGTVVLPAGQPNALVSVSNGAETGFIEYTWNGSTTYDTPNGGIVKYNTLKVSDNIAFTTAETEIRYIKFEGVKKIVTNSTDANLPNLKGIIIKDNCSIIIEKSNTISCSEGSHLGNGAAVYNGGAFTPGNTNIVGKTVTDYLGEWNTDQVVVW